MILPITYRSNNFQRYYYDNSQNFEGISPIGRYITSTFDRFSAMSKKKWYPIDETLAPFTKTLNFQKGKHIFNALDINPTNSRKYVIFYHGVGQNVSFNQEFYKRAIEKGYGVLTCEYGAFGENTEKFTQKSIRRTAQMALDYLANKDVKEVGVIGFSMGSFPAVETTKRNKNTAFLILISPYSSLKNELNKIIKGNMIKLPKFVKFLIRKFPFLVNELDRMSRVGAKLNKLDTKTYLIHSKTDKIIPYQSTQELAKKTKNLQQLIILKDGTHNIDSSKLEAFSDLPI